MNKQNRFEWFSLSIVALTIISSKCFVSYIETWNLNGLCHLWFCFDIMFVLILVSTFDSVLFLKLGVSSSIKRTIYCERFANEVCDKCLKNVFSTRSFQFRPYVLREYCIVWRASPHRGLATHDDQIIKSNSKFNGLIHAKIFNTNKFSRANRVAKRQQQIQFKSLYSNYLANFSTSNLILQEKTTKKRFSLSIRFWSFE